MPAKLLAKFTLIGYHINFHNYGKLPIYHQIMTSFKLDFKNAFNSIRRDKVLEVARQFAHKIFPFLYSCHCTPSTISLHWTWNLLISAGLMESVQMESPLPRGRPAARLFGMLLTQARSYTSLHVAQSTRDPRAAAELAETKKSKYLILARAYHFIPVVVSQDLGCFRPYRPRAVHRCCKMHPDGHPEG